MNLDWTFIVNVQFRRSVTAPIQETVYYFTAETATAALMMAIKAVVETERELLCVNAEVTECKKPGCIVI